MINLIFNIKNTIHKSKWYIFFTSDIFSVLISVSYNEPCNPIGEIWYDWKEFGYNEYGKQDCYNKFH